MLFRSAHHPRLDIFEPIAPASRMAEQGQRDRIEDRQPLAAQAVGAKFEPRAADVGERIETSGTHRRGLWRARDSGKNKEGQPARSCDCRLDIFRL